MTDKKLLPTLIVVAGPNGSGKTSITTKILQHKWIKDCHYINPDNIAQETYGGWNSPEASLLAAQQAEREREECLVAGRSLAFETVFSATDKVAFVHRAKAAGFFVRLFFIGTNSPAINASRVAMRVMEGGHDVPIPKIIERYSKSIANCAAAATFVDRVYVYDNSIDKQDARLLFRVNDGCLVREYGDQCEWSSQIVNSLENSCDEQVQDVSSRPDSSKT